MNPFKEHSIRDQLIAKVYDESVLKNMKVTVNSVGKRKVTIEDSTLDEHIARELFEVRCEEIQKHEQRRRKREARKKKREELEKEASEEIARFRKARLELKKAVDAYDFLNLC